MSKVKIRLIGTGDDVERLRTHLLKNHPQMILGKLVRIPISYGKTTFAVYGDYEFNKVRRRHGE